MALQELPPVDGGALARGRALSSRAIGWLPRLMLTLAVICFLVGRGLVPPLPLEAQPYSPLAFVIRIVLSLSWLVYAAVGALVATRRPDNAIGWIFCCMGLAWQLYGLAERWAYSSLVTNPDAVLPRGVMSGLNTWVLPLLLNMWVVSFVLVPLVFLLFPDGNVLSRRWRPIIWLAVADIIVQLATSTPNVESPRLQAAPVAHLLPPDVAPTIVAIGRERGGEVMLILFPVAVAAMVIRLRRSRGLERLRLKWFAYACVVCVLVFIPSFVGLLSAGVFEPGTSESGALVLGIPIALALAAPPCAAGIAILKYHLFDIDIIINRTLVYGVLTLTVIGVYVVTVGFLGTLFQARGNLAIALGATGLIAILFQPIRDRVQRAVDRLFYGERDDPYAILSRLGQRLEATIAPEDVLRTIVQTIAHALRLPYTAITGRPVDRSADSSGATRGADAASASPLEPETVAVYGTPVPDPLYLPLVYHNEVVGQLVLGPRAINEPFTPSDRRLLEDLARQVGIAVQTLRLTTDLQRSRERLVTAREEERRRLRRDLHDGLGPTLASLYQRLDAAAALVRSNPDAAVALLDGLKGQVKTTISDIRRIVYALRPPILDEFGLLSAIRVYAAQSGAGDSLQVSIDAPPSLPPLPAAVEVAAYRIAVEALTNVTRHAQARTCEVHLSIDGALSLEIADDGKGLPVRYHAGVGMASIRERAAEVGGESHIGVRPEGGTRVWARLPIPKE